MAAVADRYGLEMEWWRALRLIQPHEAGATTVPARNSLISLRPARKARRLPFSWKAIGCWCVPGREKPFFAVDPARCRFRNLDDWQSGSRIYPAAGDHEAPGLKPHSFRWRIRMYVIA